MHKNNGRLIFYVGTGLVQAGVYRLAILGLEGDYLGVAPLVPFKIFGGGIGYAFRLCLGFSRSYL